MVSALTGAGASSLLSTSTNLGTVRIASRMYTDMRAKTDAVEANYGDDLQSLRATRGTLTGRRDDLEAVSQAVDNGQKQVTEVRTILLEMRTLVARAEKFPESSGYYQKQFNERLKDINEIADKYSDRYNLVGNVDPKTLLPEPKTVQTADFAIETVFQGQYLGTSFNLIGTGASEGDIYQNYPTANMMQAVKRVGGDELENGAISHNSGRISGVTLSGDDEISFTLDGGTSFTGTVEKGGLGLMPSWYYDDFSDFDAIRKAIRDADDHLREVSGSLVSIDVEAKGLMSRVQRDLDSINEDISDVVKKKNDEVSAIEEETRKQYQAVEQSLSAASGDMARYRTIFQGVSLGPFTDILA